MHSCMVIFNRLMQFKIDYRPIDPQGNDVISDDILTKTKKAHDLSHSQVALTLLRHTIISFNILRLSIASQSYDADDIERRIIFIYHNNQSIVINGHVPKYQ